MKTLKIILVLAAAMVVLGCADDADAANTPAPRGISIGSLVEDNTVYVGALEHEPRRLHFAKWLRVKSSEDFTITFNGGPVLYPNSDEDVMATGVNATMSVSNAVPITSGEWHLISCSATIITLTDCDAGTATIIVEY